MWYKWLDGGFRPIQPISVIYLHSGYTQCNCIFKLVSISKLLFFYFKDPGANVPFCIRPCVICVQMCWWALKMCDTFVQKLSAVFIVDSSPEITQCRWCHLFRIIFSILFLAFIRALHVRLTMRNVVLVVTDDTLHTDNHMPSIPFLKASSSATFSYENIIKYSCRAIPFVYFHFVLSWRISQCWQCRCHRMRSSKCVCCSFFLCCLLAHYFALIINALRNRLAHCL